MENKEQGQWKDDGQWLKRGERELSSYGRHPVGLAFSREDALAGWVGEERAASVFSDLRPLHDDISVLVDKVLGKINHGDTLLLSKLQNGWRELFGGMIASQCSPLSVSDGHLKIEVNNATCMYVFERQQKSFFLSHIMEFTGGELKSIEFVPRGSRSRNAGKPRNA